MKRIIIIVALICATSISVFSQKSDKKSDKTSKAKEQVTALVNEFATALVKGDVATLERILSDDYTSVVTVPTTKKMLIESIKVNANNPDINKLTAIDFDNSAANIRLYDNVAVMVGGRDHERVFRMRVPGFWSDKVAGWVASMRVRC